MCYQSCTGDHFVYRSAGATRPPLLSLLPARDFLTKSEIAIGLDFPGGLIGLGMYTRTTTGLLRRGEDGVLVVQVGLWYPGDGRRPMAEFTVLRPGMHQWVLMEPVPIAQDEPGNLHLHSDNAVTCVVGDRFVCWFDCDNGFLLCDMHG